MPDMQISGECRYQACSKHYQHSFIMSTAKSKYLSSIWQGKGPGTTSISVIAKGSRYISLGFATGGMTKLMKILAAMCLEDPWYLPTGRKTPEW